MLCVHSRVQFNKIYDNSFYNLDLVINKNQQVYKVKNLQLKNFYLQITKLITSTDTWYNKKRLRQLEDL